MRIIILMLIASFCIADGFVDAITSGEKEGDVYLLFDYTDSSPDISRTKYQDAAYLAASVGLYYTSSFYGYFRAHIGFRGAIPLIQSSKGIMFDGGRGAAARDFWRSDRAMFSKSYIEYFDGDTSIKAGRLEQKTDLVDKEIDGIWLQNKSLGYLLIDIAWINQYGRVLPRELSEFDKFDTKYGGAYYLGLTLDVIEEMLKLKLYGQISPQFYSYLALKAMLDIQYINASAGVVGGFEHKNSSFRDENSFLFNADVGFDFNIFYGKLGYIKSAPSVGIGSLGSVGNTFSPFFYFSGDALNNQRNVDLVYAKLGIQANVLKAYIVYGYNSFNLNHSIDSSKYSQGEVNVYFDWNIFEATNAIFYFINTHGAKQAIPTINQLGLAFKFSF